MYPVCEETPRFNFCACIECHIKRVVRMASPEMWGPRMWRLLHGLADLSDRRDIYPLWNTFLKYTAIVLPCQKCQHHMADYWRIHRFLPKGWDRLTGTHVRTEIRAKLHAFHNDVNARLGKPCPPLAPLGTLDRVALGQEIQSLFDSLREEWVAAHLEWKRTGALLVSLVKSGPQI